MTSHDLEKLLAEAIPGPYRCDKGANKIWAPSKKGGETFIADIRGWGYLTGKGSGALGLDDVEAVAIQKATGDLLAASFTLARDLITAREEIEEQAALIGEERIFAQRAIEQANARAEAAEKRVAEMREALGEIKNIAKGTGDRNDPPSPFCCYGMQRIAAIASMGEKDAIRQHDL